MSELNLDVYGITLSWNGNDARGASITSSLHEEDVPENALYNAAVDGIESMVLAHFCAGVDVTDPAYLEGVETACQAIANNMPEPENVAKVEKADPAFRYFSCKLTEVNGEAEYLSRFLILCAPMENPKAVLESVAMSWRGEGTYDADNGLFRFDDGLAVKQPEMKEIPVEDYRVLRQHMNTYFHTDEPGRDLAAPQENGLGL